VARLTAFVASLAALSAITAATAPAHATPTRDTAVHHIAVIGDSYTNGTAIGGLGPNSWTARAWQTLARQGVQIAADVASEGRAGYGVRGDQGSVFEDLTARAVHPDDRLIVFFGSRNDQDDESGQLAEMARESFDLAHRIAPSASLLVIGPPWPTAAIPSSVLQVRDVLESEARAAGATFVDPLAEHWFVGRPDLIGADGVHPTDAGHAYLASKIAPLIRGQLPRRT
jgi:lysophospholipase L1-like esterase